jgi:hypothetical protein
MKAFKFLQLSLIVMVLASCSKVELQEVPPHLITSETLYTNYAGFDAGINGVYALIRQTDEGLNGGSSLTSDLFRLGTDNLVSNHQVSPFNVVTTQWVNTNNSTNDFYANAFSWLYNIINACNTIIAKAENPDVVWGSTTGNATQNKQYVLANARAARAWAYRHLTFLWGDVPLNLDESKGSNIVTNWTRTAKADIQKVMISDWRYAAQYIPVEPIPGRISKGAIAHYLAETYLVRNELDSALFFTNQVIGTPNYKLVTARYGVKKDKPGVAFMDMFMEGNTNREEGNTEALWVFQFAKQTVGGGANSFPKRHHISRYNSIKVGSVNPFRFTVERGGRGLGRNSLTKFAIDCYGKEDDRGSEFAIRKFFILRTAAENAPAEADILPAGYKYGDTIRLNWAKDIAPGNVGVVDWPYSRKVEYVDPANISGDLDFKDQIHLRLADTYLLKAEVLFKMNRTSEAAEVINIIRGRSHALPISAADLSIDFILDERSRELVLEEDRRYTLLRTNKWIERTQKYNKNGGQFIVARDALFPIPQVVINANLTQKMTQNEGY